jgi:hypothetical protein
MFPMQSLPSITKFWFHAIPLAVWLIFGSIGLLLKVFGPIGFPEMGCWVGDYPYGCAFTDTCTRGYKFYDYVNWYGWMFCIIWLFLSFIVILVNSILIYTAIRTQEQRNAKYLSELLRGSCNATSVIDHMMNNNRELERPESAPPVNIEVVVADTESSDHHNHIQITPEDYLFQGRSNDHTTGSPSHHSNVVVARRKMKQSRTAAVQSSLYCGSALFTAVWIFLIWLSGYLVVPARVYFFLAWMVNIVLPSQGIFNLFIFVRLQYLQLRSNHQDWNRWRCMKQCMFSAA